MATHQQQLNQNNEDMDSSLSIVVTRNRKSKHNNPELYTGVNELNDNNNSNSKRSFKNTKVWSRGQKLVWNKCRTFWKHQSSRYNFRRQRRNEGLDTRNNIKSCWSSRTDRRNNRLDYKYYYYILVGLLTIGSVPVLAEDAPESEVNNTSNPVAAATGNVTNSAVQFQNNGAPSRQNYGGGISCNGSTMTFSPFYMGNHINPYSEKEGLDGLYPSSYQLNENWGFQVNFMIPLDKRGLEQCRRIAKRQEEKMRLDHELVRALKCAELQQKGFTFRPETRVAHLCSDVVPIQALLPPKPQKKRFWQR